MPLATFRQQPLVFLSTALAAGIAADRFCGGSVFFWLACMAGALLVWMGCWWRERLVWGALMTMTATVAAGAAWHHTYWNHYPSDDLGLVADTLARPICVEARVMTHPWVRAPPPDDPLCLLPRRPRTQCTIAYRAVRDGTQWRPASGRARMLIDGHLHGIVAGDVVRVFGQWAKPGDARNPGDFDYRRAERSRRRLSVLFVRYPECVQLIDRPRSAWRHRRDHLRQRGVALLRRYIAPRRAALAGALLLGVRDELEPERTDAYFRTGTIHLLAISGLHVGLLGIGIWRMACILARSYRFGLAAAAMAVWVYAILAEARPPVVRAAVLVSVVCLARFVHRYAHGRNSLALAGLVVLAINPTELFQTGTQLSFIAVATLTAYVRSQDAASEWTDPLERLLRSKRSWLETTIRGVVAWWFRLFGASALVWAATLPLVAYRFHVVSPVALLVNPVIWVPLTGALFCGFALLLLGPWLPGTAIVFGWLCDRCLALLDGLVNVAERLPGSHVWVAGPAAWWVCGFYAVLAVWLIGVDIPAWRKACRWGLVVWLMAGIAHQMAVPVYRRVAVRPALTVTFVAVGHGTSVLLEFPTGENVLYDAGSQASPASAAQSISHVLWSRGITRLDAIMLSHPDTDHYNAVPELLDRFAVRRVVVSPFMFRKRSPGTDVLAQSIAAAGVPLHEMSAGHTWQLGNSTGIRVLFPPSHQPLATDNANSLVVEAFGAGRQVLLPGDSESPALEQLVQMPRRNGDLAMVPHHGSTTSDSRPFLRWTGAKRFVVSGGLRDYATTRSHSLVDHSAQLLHTADAGAIRGTLTPTSVQVRRWRYDRW